MQLDLKGAQIKPLQFDVLGDGRHHTGFEVEVHIRKLPAELAKLIVKIAQCLLR